MMASNFPKTTAVSVAVAFIIRLRSQPDEDGRPKRPMSLLLLLPPPPHTHTHWPPWPVYGLHRVGIRKSLPDGQTTLPGYGLLRSP